MSTYSTDLNSILKNKDLSGEVILFVDELHTIVGKFIDSQRMHPLPDYISYNVDCLMSKLQTSNLSLQVLGKEKDRWT